MRIIIVVVYFVVLLGRLNENIYIKYLIAMLIVIMSLISSYFPQREFKTEARGLRNREEEVHRLYDPVLATFL